MDDAEALIENAWRARRQGRLADAETLLLEAIDTSRNAGLRLVLIRGLKALAHVVRDQEQSERALRLYEEAVVLTREEGDPLLIGHTVRHLGDLHREAGRLNDAESCYDEALALYRGAPDVPPLDFANALRPAALLKEMEGDLEAAEELWSQALTLYKAVGVHEGVKECERHLSRRG